MNKDRLKRYCDLMLCSIERRKDFIKDSYIKNDIERKYYKLCTELTEWEFNNIGNIETITNRIEKIESNLYKYINPDLIEAV